MQILKKLTDDQLVAMYAKGSNEAFDTLLSRHQSRVFSYILHIVKNRDLAEDVFQETFVKAIMTIKQGRYTENGKFSAWITRIAHNFNGSSVARDQVGYLIQTCLVESWKDSEVADKIKSEFAKAVKECNYQIGK